MKLKGKMIARILIPVILVGMLVVPLAANASPTVSIEDASAPKGETVTVSIDITDVENMCGANIWLSYDKNVVTVEKVDDGDIGTVTYSIDNDAGIVKMAWDTTEGKTGSFVFAYITLKAVGNPGDTSPLDLDVKELYDCDLNDIMHTVTDGTFTIPQECGNMNVNPTSWSPTIKCGESDSQIVTVSASGGIVKGVTVSIKSGPTWLSVSPTNLGDISDGSSKTFKMDASPPAGTSGDFTYTVRVSNTCGTPTTKDVTGTIHVPCCGNMNVNPTSWSPTIKCGESDSKMVTVSASSGPVKGVTVSKVSGPAWLSVSPTNLGDISDGSSKTFKMDASPPAGTSGDFTYTVRVSNTCGTPTTKDVTGTIHVDCPFETRVSIKCASASQGSTVTVPIDITDVENMCGANIWLSYDKQVVTVEKVDDGDIGTVTYNIDNAAGITKMTWDTTEGKTGSFVFAYITLKAVGNPGDTSPLDLDVKELYDCALADITHTVADGTFTIPLTPPCAIAQVAYDRSTLHSEDVDVLILNPLRELRDDNLKDEYVNRYYDYSHELTIVMTRDPALAYEAARLLVKYSPMVRHKVNGIGVDKQITRRDVKELVSFTDRLKRGVWKNRKDIGTGRSLEIIKSLNEFNEQVEASKGKTFSEALQDSIYYKGEPMPDLVITNIRLDGNKVKYTIENQGEAAKKGLIVNILLVDGVPVSMNLIIRSIQPSQSLEKTFRIFRQTEIGASTIVVCADFKNRVTESDEENNCLVLHGKPLERRENN